MDYLICFAHMHVTFRRPELEALAKLENVQIEILEYDIDSPFCVIRFHQPSQRTTAKSLDQIARDFISRSIMSRAIYELWGRGLTYDELHQDVRSRSRHLWEKYVQASFKFSVHAFLETRSSAQQKEIIDSFRYLGFEGKIQMKNPEVEFLVAEEWHVPETSSNDIDNVGEVEASGLASTRKLKRLFLGKFVGSSGRHLAKKHDLKKRPYISTTSMDAELALVTVTLALAAPGKLFLDPFVGTGGFMVAASELGVVTLGADIDGRSFRGKGPGLQKGVAANLRKYGLTSLFGDCIVSDLTNTPLRTQSSWTPKQNRWLDGIVADPPYGIREGLKVLGMKTGQSSVSEHDADEKHGAANKPEPVARQHHYIDGVPSYLLPDYIRPKKPYSFARMLDDILNFAARTLVDGGRLAFWMPTANEADQELALPAHPLLERKHECVQIFNKWSRRLLVYERTPGDLTAQTQNLSLSEEDMRETDAGTNADDLNPFRKRYFDGFK